TCNRAQSDGRRPTQPGRDPDCLPVPVPPAHGADMKYPDWDSRWVFHGDAPRAVDRGPSCNRLNVRLGMSAFVKGFGCRSRRGRATRDAKMSRCSDVAYWHVATDRAVAAMVAVGGIVLQNPGMFLQLGRI